jgi:CheY-like chemotaxis protein
MAGPGLAWRSASRWRIDGRTDFGAVQIPGRGSAFVSSCRSPAAERAQRRRVEPAFQVTEPETLARILLAEDHPTNQKVVAMILEPIGAELTIVDNGQAAVEAARAGAFDLILMDIQMPIMDGLGGDGADPRAEQASGVRTPIICLTANGESETQACLAAGGDRHLAKPFRAEALLQTVFDLLSRDVEAA